MAPVVHTRHSDLGLRWVCPVSYGATHAAGRDGPEVGLDSEDFRIVVDNPWFDLPGEGVSGLV